MTVISIRKRDPGLTFCWLVLLLSSMVGCSSIPADLGGSDVVQLVESRAQLTVPINDRQQLDLIDRPLSSEDAIRLALYGNYEFRAQMAQLGFSMADLYAASRVRNPLLSVSVMESSQSGAQRQITFGLVASFVDLLTLRSRKSMAELDLLSMQQHIAHHGLLTAKHTQMAFYQYASALQNESLQKQILHADETAYELGQRFWAAGNMTQRTLAQLKAQWAHSEVSVLQARVDSNAARRVLAAILGIPANSDWQIDSSLSLPAADLPEISELADAASQNRLDLAAAKVKAQRYAKEARMVEWSRWIEDFEIGFETERETDGARLNGPHLEWALPLFSQNQDRMMRTQTQLSLSAIELMQLGQEIADAIWLAGRGLGIAHEKVRLIRDELIPAQMVQTQEAEAEEAFMLIGVFELLERKREELTSYHAYIEALTEFWQRAAELSFAVGAQIPGLSASQSFDVAALAQSADEATTSESMHHHPDSSGEPANQKNHQHHQHHQNHSGAHH